VPGLMLTLLGDEELRADAHSELTVRLVLEGITHDPTGRRPLSGWRSACRRGR
jgi:hypothetical protein